MFARKMKAPAMGIAVETHPIGAGKGMDGDGDTHAEPDGDEFGEFAPQHEGPLTPEKMHTITLAKATPEQLREALKMHGEPDGDEDGEPDGDEAEEGGEDDGDEDEEEPSGGSYT